MVWVIGYQERKKDEALCDLISYKKIVSNKYRLIFYELVFELNKGCLFSKIRSSINSGLCKEFLCGFQSIMIQKELT